MVIAAGCGETNRGTDDTGGAAGTDGNTSPGASGSANEQATGGSGGTGGESATGGTSYATGGSSSRGGRTGTGGRSSNGGASAAGGATPTGGSQATGGRAADGGSSPAGASATGGSSDAGTSSTAGNGGEEAGSGAGGDGSGSAGANGSAGAMARPAGNTGTGFFTRDGKLYDANGVEFLIKGVDTCHYDENWASCSSDCGIPNSRANVNRMGTPLWASISDATLRDLMGKMISQHIVPLPTVWFVDESYSDESNVTCKDDSGPGSAFATAVGQWVARASLFKPYEKYMLLGIANEWGPSDSADWRDAYIDAVAALRDAGYLCTLVIDAGGCGQDVSDIAKYAQAVYDSDPQHNIMFDEHIYGMWGTQATGLENWQTDLAQGFDQLLDTGLPLLIGEFGPGRDIGPSPTMMTPGTIIQAANDHGFGWLAWAWDDGYGSGGDGFALSNRGAFSLTAGEPTNGDYPDNTDLTAYGNEVVLNPSYGTFASAKPATIF
jgi:mannan endo-1,4-beta-mannosidase